MPKQKGFAPIIGLVIAGILVIGASAGGYVYLKSDVPNVQGVSNTSGEYQNPFAYLFSKIFGKKTSIETSNYPSASNSATSSPETTIVNSNLDINNLPLGDNKYSTSPKKGYVYSCQTEFNGSGAFQAGPWIDQTAKTWDLSEKVTIDGNVAWPNATWTVSVDGTTRKLTGNGLPTIHNTGTYPVSSSDDAYQYDRNPNSIKEQSLSLSLPTNPTLLSTPECVGGEVGIMLSGIPIFNGFDAGGRDAVAWEVQDKCGGHPQSSGQYHYHGPSSCLEDETGSSEHSALVGYAFDGLGIFGLKGEEGVELSTNSLDECHGHTHSITWDAETKNIYHYHLTYDFPYSVSCFRAKKAVSGPLGGGGMGQGGQKMQKSGAGGQQGGSSGQGSKQPPQAAITACSSKSSGSLCQFTSPNGAVSGTCQTPPGGSSLACIPTK